MSTENKPFISAASKAEQVETFTITKKSIAKKEIFHLQELKRKPAAELAKMAHEVGIENARMPKQALIFAIL